jgi:hypothetical protein
VSVFEFVVIERPTKRDEEKGEVERVLHGPKVLTAADAAQAKTQALLDFKLPEGVVKSRVEVLVRLFEDAS